MPNFPEKYPTPLEFLDAVEKNGWEQTKGDLFKVEADGSISACAAGQALLNLGIVTTEEVLEEKKIGTLGYLQASCGRWLHNGFSRLYFDVYQLNDSEAGASCKEIAEKLRPVYAGS